MFKDVIIGQYIKGESIIHRMDPKIKIVITLIYMILLFVIKTVPSYILISIFTLFFVASCKISFRIILKSLKPVLIILLSTAVINLFLTPGNPLFSVNVFNIFSLSISSEGIRIASMMVIRLLYLVLATSVLTLTTTPLKLTDGIERLLKPLNLIKISSHEIAMMMTIALRFIPTLADETDKIIKAQKARGADFESGGIIKRAKALIPILVPLFVSAFRRADELATAMESRCYNGGDGRTKMNETHISKLDVFALLIVVLFTALLLAVEFVL